MIKKKYFDIFIYLNLILIALFGRSFVGIEIVGFRIGEYYIAIGLTASLILFKKIFENDKNLKLNVNIFLIYLNFIFLIIFHKSNILDTYVYKSSSYIWTLNYFLIGYIYFTKKINSERLISALRLLLIYQYILSVIYYPEFLIRFFKNYSDKFAFNKATDLLALFVITLFFTSQFKKYEYKDFIFFVLISSIFLPLFLYMSRGSFISVFIFVIWELFNKRKYFLVSFSKSAFLIILSCMLFVLSGFLVQDNEYSFPEPATVISDLAGNKNTNSSIFSFYFSDNRIFSNDGNLNWRLQIWQDVYFDLKENKSLLTGYGYDSIIPAMDDPKRQGLNRVRDADYIPNEHVHSYLVNIFARGGVVQVLLFIGFYLNLLFHINPPERSNIIKFLLPFLLASMFDISMEGVQFPILFFFSLSYIFKNARD